MANSSAGFAAIHELSNPLLTGEGGVEVPELSLRVRIEWVLEDGSDENQSSLHSIITITSFNSQPVSLDLSVRFGTAFLDIFEVRTLVPTPPHRIISRHVATSSVILANQGEDGQWRSTSLRFTPDPTSLAETQASYQLRLAPAESHSLAIRITTAVSS
jgi:hypothetical protein